jgi:hypothetical protein
MEGGGSGTSVGDVRAMTFSGSAVVFREQLVAFSDKDHTLTYKVLGDTLPVKNAVTTIALRRITDTNQTYGEWSSEFDCRQGKEEEDMKFLPKVFAGGWKSLKRHLAASTS